MKTVRKNPKVFYAKFQLHSKIEKDKKRPRWPNQIAETGKVCRTHSLKKTKKKRCMRTKGAAGSHGSTTPKVAKHMDLEDKCR